MWWEIVMWIVFGGSAYGGIGAATAVYNAKESYREAIADIDKAWSRRRNEYYSYSSRSDSEYMAKARVKWEVEYRQEAEANAGHDGLWAGVVWPLFWVMLTVVQSIKGVDRTNDAIRSKLGRIASDPIEAEQRAAKQLEDARQIVAEHEAKKKREWEAAAADALINSRTSGTKQIGA